MYSWGVGIESAIYAEENFFLADRSFTVDQIIERFNGTTLSASGTLVVGPRVRNPVDVIAAWNAVNDPDLGFDAGWMPTLELRAAAGVDHAAARAAVRGSVRVDQSRCGVVRARRTGGDRVRTRTRAAGGRSIAPRSQSLLRARGRSCHEGRASAARRRRRLHGLSLLRRRCQTRA